MPMVEQVQCDGGPIIEGWQSKKPCGWRGSVDLHESDTCPQCGGRLWLNQEDIGYDWFGNR